MPPSRNWRWTAPIFPGGAQWIQSPCRLPRSLANLVSQSQIRLAHFDNRVRNSNDKNQAPDALQASSVANEAPLEMRYAPFPFAQQLDQTCDTSSYRSTPIRRKPQQSSGRVLSLF